MHVCDCLKGAGDAFLRIQNLLNFCLYSQKKHYEAYGQTDVKLFSLFWDGLVNSLF